MAERAYLEQRVVYIISFRTFTCVIVSSVCDGLDMIQIEIIKSFLAPNYHYYSNFPFRSSRNGLRAYSNFCK